MSVPEKCYKFVFVFLIWVWMFVSSAFAALVMMVTSVVLRREQHCQVMCWMQSSFLLVFVYCYERHANFRVRLSGDMPKEGESAFCLANHINHDWAPMYSIGWRINMLGNIRGIIKDSIKYIPGFGWAMSQCGWCFLARNWATDESYIKDRMANYRENAMPLNFWMFPEGTRRTAALMERSKKFAEDRKLKALKNCLQPRTKGFVAVAKDLDGVCDMIYDVNFAYDGWKFGKRNGPGPLQMLFPEPGRMQTFHINLRKIPLSDLPKKEEELQEWCFELFQAKDKVMEHFEANGQFPNPKTLKRMQYHDWVPQFLLMSLMDLVLGTLLWKLICMVW